MQTYYRKHQQIRAFQFDGTWQQLEQELPSTVFLDMYNDVKQIDKDSWNKMFIHYDNQSRIKAMRLFESPWPNRNVYMHKRFNAYRWSYFKYQLLGNILHPGDYVQLIWRNYNLPDGHYLHHLEWLGEYRLKFYTSAHFESTWCKYPKKKGK